MAISLIHEIAALHSHSFVTLAKTGWVGQRGDGRIIYEHTLCDANYVMSGEEKDEIAALHSHSFVT